MAPEMQSTWVDKIVDPNKFWAVNAVAFRNLNCYHGEVFMLLPVALIRAVSKPQENLIRRYRCEILLEPGSWDTPGGDQTGGIDCG